MEIELTEKEIDEIAPDFREAQEFTRQHLNVELQMRCWKNLDTGEYRWVYRVGGYREHTEYVLELLRLSIEGLLPNQQNQ